MMNEYIPRIFKEKEGLFYALCGIIIGLLLLIYPAALFLAAVMIIVSYFIYNRADDDEKAFIVRIFYIAISLRLIFIIVTHILATYYGFGPKSSVFPGMEGGTIIGDEMGSHQTALSLIKTINGVPLSKNEMKFLFKSGEYGWSPHIYILGFFYYLFGCVPILGKCINALFGALTGITVYFITKESFGIKAAKLACILTLFYPIIFLWSISNLKDTMLIFLFTFIGYIYIMFYRSRKIGYLFLFAVSFFLINNYRAGTIALLISCAAISFLINIRWRYKKITVAAAILAFILLVNIFSGYFSSYFKSIAEKTKIQLLVRKQVGYVVTGGTVYKIYPERLYKDKGFGPITKKEFVVSLFKGVLSVMFKPFPWEIDNRAKLFYYPISMIWNALFPFFAVGLLVSIRYKFKDVVFLLSIFILTLVSFSLTEGNVGTMIRHRDMITPIYIIFSSIGISQLLSRQYLEKQEQL